MKLAELMQQIQQASGNITDMIALKERLNTMGIDLENIYQELEMSSSYVDSHRDISNESSVLKPHSHSFYELIHCGSCDNMQYLMGTERYRLQKGDVLWIPPGVSHCPLFPESMKAPYERIVLWVNAELMAKFYQRWPKLAGDRDVYRRHYLLRTAGTRWERPVREAFQRGCAESERREMGWEAVLYGNTNMLIPLLSRAMSKDKRPPASEKSEIVDELLEYVAGHLNEKITVSDAARRLLVSESTVTHLCRKWLGISFYRYVTLQRLNLARQLMQENMDLSLVAERAGFCDYTAFFRAFKKEYGLSPKEYRKIQGAGQSML